MSQQNDYVSDIYNKLNGWLNDVAAQQKPHIEQFVKQAKLYASAAETMSEEKLQQFTDNLRYDLHDFYKLNRAEAKNSVYLGLLSEALWDNLAKLTDKSQVEWAEILEDFNHDGFYHTGDFIGFGELECEQCQEITTVMHFSKISNCIHCDSKTFIRLPLKP